jgi:cell division protein FtsI (penicillin-binding protein 3)
MCKGKNLNFDNIRPNSQSLLTRKINFRDKNDFIKNVEKEKNINFAKKSNLIIFLLTVSFISFVSFNLLKISFQKDKNYTAFQNKKIKKRGKVLDNNNEIVATSLETKDLYIDLRKSLDRSVLKENLIDIFENKSEDFFDKIFERNQYSLISKDLSLTDINKLKLLGDPAIQLHKSNKRVYPQHNLFSHIIGLKTSNLSSKLEKNLDYKLSEGEDIKLTLDLRVQNIVRDELQKSIENYQAKSALALIMNVNNGNIVSMVSLPDFNPNYPKLILPNTENNLLTEARYEMGSTLKIFNAAIAYELNSRAQNQEFDISNGLQITNKKKIIDNHIKKKILNFDEVFIKSSNIGSVKILESIGYESQESFYELVGLKDKLKIEGLKTVSNKLPNNWESHSKFISYGYGISVSPISLATAFCSLVNGGYKIEPKLINLEKENNHQQILSSKTSQKINSLIKKIVTDGTGKFALVNGVSVGGKTGTSKKAEMGSYSDNKVITSFIGVFPSENPKFLTFVLFDEPETNINNSPDNTGGNTAAPTFSKIVKKISPIIDIDNYF